MNRLLAGWLAAALLCGACTSAQPTNTEAAINSDVDQLTASAPAPAALATDSKAATSGVLASQAASEIAEATAETPVLVATPTGFATVVPAATSTALAPAVDIDTVIEYELRKSFDFFWEQANTQAGSPGYGLIRDRWPGAEGIASIASVGFGLTAYVVGVEKGYITREQGLERASGTLDTLLGMERTEGFYYHFVNQATGQRAWKSEVSTIDTSILVMGVLAAGQYFGGEVAQKAEKIYAGINWPWFFDEQKGMFYMAYRPENAADKRYEGHWDYYAEQLMLYVLAAGSDTHPIDDATYYGFTRHTSSFGGGPKFIHSWFGSIFTYQYSHAWIDFKPYTDKQGVNWFDNSVSASLAQYEFAVEVDDQYETIGPLAWGLTASDGPDGYNGLYGAPPSGSNDSAHRVDDTLAPSGAIGSIIFTPQQAEQAMQNYYSLERVKGRYGFVDAYNLTRNWFDTDVIGIDKGVTVLMLANYQNDTVHAVMMRNPHILRGLSRLGLEAGGAAATATTAP
ncbi:MAG: glucoamylase family protein [Anaerolineales bacterium]